MGTKEDKTFNVDSFIDTHMHDNIYNEEAVCFFDGINVSYGRFYTERYTKREGRKKIAQNSQQDPRVRSED